MTLSIHWLSKDDIQDFWPEQLEEGSCNGLIWGRQGIGCVGRGQEALSQSNREVGKAVDTEERIQGEA